MAYKDKDKQKQANKEAAKRYRKTKQGMTQGIRPAVIPENVIPETITIDDQARSMVEMAVSQSKLRAKTVIKLREGA